MFYTYVLYSKNYNKIYIGFTSNIDGRLAAHNHISNKGWTKSFMPWDILFYETFETKVEATKREKELKSSRGRAYIKSKIL